MEPKKFLEKIFRRGEVILAQDLKVGVGMDEMVKINNS